jgi:hypothetical protein
MSLNFGFNYGHTGDEKVWTERYQNLNEEDKDFYHNSLPWLLMCVGIPYVCSTTIPAIVKRHKLSRILDKVTDDKWLEGHLHKFIGFETNVGFMTDNEFLKKVGRMNDIKFKYNEDKLWKTYKKEVFEN